MKKSKIKILLVDDEPDILEILSFNLSNEGYKIFTAENGKEALDVAVKQLPDLIILDVMMPIMDGVETCERLRMDKRFKDTLIMFLSARGEDYSQVAAFESGADDYVTKPFSVRELILRIKAILKRGSSQKNETVEIERQFGDLVIDIDSHEVFVNKEQISLTALEFRLLSQLIDRRGRVQSRDQLLSDVWGYSAEVTTRTVDTHIKRLREKLGTMGKYVQTIRGVGYKFSRTPD